jgi:hypothetical protein
VDHFSSVVAPLTAFTGATGKGRARKPIQAIDWNNLSEEQVKSFQENKKILVTAPVLANPDLNKPIQVHIGASVVGTGGVLIHEGRVVLYTSSKFAPAEFDYGTPEQELLVLCAPC